MGRIIGKGPEDHYKDLVTRIEVEGLTRLWVNFSMNGYRYLKKAGEEYHLPKIVKAFPTRIEQIADCYITEFDNTTPQETIDERLRNAITGDIKSSRICSDGANAFYASDLQKVEDMWVYALTFYQIK